MKKKNNGKHKHFLHALMIQSNSKYLFATSVKCSYYKIPPFFHRLAKTYPFRSHGFHTPVEWKIGHKVIIQIIIVNAEFYIYGNKRSKEISILTSFEQIQENTISGSAFSARLGSSAVAFTPDRDLDIPREKYLNHLQTVETLIRHLIWVCTVYQLHDCHVLEIWLIIILEQHTCYNMYTKLKTIINQPYMKM